MNIFVIQHSSNDNSLAAFASNRTMWDFLSQWKPEIISGDMTLKETKDFILFLENQNDATKIDEISIFAFGYSLMKKVLGE